MADGTASKTFAAAFQDHLATSGRTVMDISRESGVPKDALYSLKYGKSRSMGVDDAIRVAGAFDMTVDVFMGLRPPAVTPEMSRLFSQMTSREQLLVAATIAALRPPSSN